MLLFYTVKDHLINKFSPYFILFKITINTLTRINWLSRGGAELKRPFFNVTKIERNSLTAAFFMKQRKCLMNLFCKTVFNLLISHLFSKQPNPY